MKKEKGWETRLVHGSKELQNKLFFRTISELLRIRVSENNSNNDAKSPVAKHLITAGPDIG